MDSEIQIEITDRDGWRKEFNLQKRIIYIGCDSRNDVILNPLRGAGVASRHLQLIASPGAPVVYTVVNLSDIGITLGEARDRSLEPYSAVEIADGEKLQLGEYTLVFHLTTAAGLSESPSLAADTGMRLSTGSASIGLRIALPQTNLSAEKPVEGTVFVCNQGNLPGVQFNLALEGLPSDCYEIGPAPILFPGAEKGVFLRLHHPRRPGYAVGMHKITIRAEAVEAYPGESSVAARDIYIAPYYKHTLRILSKN